MYCPRCRAENPQRARFCIACGEPIATGCPACGAEVPATARFCPDCGVSLSDESSARRGQAPSAGVVNHFAGATLYEFSRAYGDVPDSADKRFIQQIVHYVIDRDL